VTLTEVEIVLENITRYAKSKSQKWIVNSYLRVIVLYPLLEQLDIFPLFARETLPAGVSLDAGLPGVNGASLEK